MRGILFLLLILGLNVEASIARWAAAGTVSEVHPSHHRLSTNAPMSRRIRREPPRKAFGSTSRRALLLDAVSDLRGGDVILNGVADSADRAGLLAINYEPLIAGAYGWCCNLGAPSALVAGVVVGEQVVGTERGDVVPHQLERHPVVAGREPQLVEADGLVVVGDSRREAHVGKTHD